MKTRILIAICSCHRHAGRRAAIRETWLMNLPLGIRAVFFLGSGPESIEPDVVQLPVDDSYEQLPGKVHAFCRHALENFKFDGLFKCDDDTYVHAGRLGRLLNDWPAEDRELLGEADYFHDGFAQGGAGYYLSRRAVGLVAEARPNYGRFQEDLWVSMVLQQAGVRLHASDRLRRHHRDFPRTDNDLVTAHECNPPLMRLIHQGFSHPGSIDVVMLFRGQHRHQWDTLRLLRNGVFLTKNGDLAGRWNMHPGNQSLELDWDNWRGRQVLEKTADGFQNDRLQLHLLGTSQPVTSQSRR